MAQMTSPDNSKALRLLLVDDHAIVREGLKRVLAIGGPHWVIAEASDGFKAQEQLRTQSVDLVIADLSMPGMNGLELIARLQSSHPALPVLVLSMHAEEQYAMRAFKAGAKGYVTKDTAADELVAAVHRLAAGGAYISASLSQSVVQMLGSGHQSASHAKLSNREMEVLQRIVAGQRLIDIAAVLHLSVKTISTHKRHVQEKLQLPSTAALIRYGMEHNLGRGLGGAVEPA